MEWKKDMTDIATSIKSQSLDDIVTLSLIGTPEQREIASAELKSMHYQIPQWRLDRHQDSMDMESDARARLEDTQH